MKNFICPPPASAMFRVPSRIIALAFTLILLAVQLPAANVVLHFTQPFTTNLDTNVFIAWPISSNILANGSVTMTGLPQRITPSTNGYATNYFNTGWYAVQDSVTKSQVVINVYDSSQTFYDVTNLLQSGFNTYVVSVFGTNPPPTYNQITNALGFAPASGSSNITSTASATTNGIVNSILYLSTNYDALGAASTVQTFANSASNFSATATAAVQTFATGVSNNVGAVQTYAGSISNQQYTTAGFANSATTALSNNVATAQSTANTGISFGQGVSNSVTGSQNYSTGVSNTVFTLNALTTNATASLSNLTATAQTTANNAQTFASTVSNNVTSEHNFAVTTSNTVVTLNTFTTNATASLSNQIANVTANTNGVSAINATNIANGAALNATNNLPTMAFASTNQFIRTNALPALTNGFVTAGVTNGLATTNWVQAGYDTNNAGIASALIATNGLGSAAFSNASAFYLNNNPSNYQSGAQVASTIGTSNANYPTLTVFSGATNQVATNAAGNLILTNNALVADIASSTNQVFLAGTLINIFGNSFNTNTLGISRAIDGSLTSSLFIWNGSKYTNTASPPSVTYITNSFIGNGVWTMFDGGAGLILTNSSAFIPQTPLGHYTDAGGDYADVYFYGLTLTAYQPSSANLTNWSTVTTNTIPTMTQLNTASNFLSGQISSAGVSAATATNISLVSATNVATALIGSSNANYTPTATLLVMTNTVTTNVLGLVAAQTNTLATNGAALLAGGTNAAIVQARSDIAATNATFIAGQLINLTSSNIVANSKLNLDGMTLLSVATNVIGSGGSFEGYDATYILSTGSTWTNNIYPAWAMVLSGGTLYRQSNSVTYDSVPWSTLTTVTNPVQMTVVAPGQAPAPFVWTGVTNTGNGYVIGGNPSIPAYDAKIQSATNLQTATLGTLATNVATALTAAVAKGVAASSNSLTLYVANWGSDTTNNGTSPLSPFLTFYHAQNVAVAGDTIHLMDGTNFGGNDPTNWCYLPVGVGFFGDPNAWLIVTNDLPAMSSGRGFPMFGTLGNNNIFNLHLLIEDSNGTQTPIGYGLGGAGMITNNIGETNINFYDLVLISMGSGIHIEDGTNVLSSVCTNFLQMTFYNPVVIGNNCCLNLEGYQNCQISIFNPNFTVTNWFANTLGNSKPMRVIDLEGQYGIMTSNACVIRGGTFHYSDADAISNRPVYAVWYLGSAGLVKTNTLQLRDVALDPFAITNSASLDFSTNTPQAVSICNVRRLDNKPLTFGDNNINILDWAYNNNAGALTNVQSNVIMGNTNGTPSPTGIVGETLVSTVNLFTPYTVQNGAITNFYISLTAGVWRVQGVVTFLESSATVTHRAALFSVGSNTILNGNSGLAVYNDAATVTASQTNTLSMPSREFTVTTATTNLYLNFLCSFSTGTVTAGGSITAFRNN